MAETTSEGLASQPGEDEQNQPDNIEGKSSVETDLQRSETCEIRTADGIKQKRPPRSEKKRRRHEELLVKRREDRKMKKIDRKMRLKEQRIHLNDSEERLNPNECKEERRKRCRQALDDGHKICIDCSLEGFMSEKEIGKLVMQIGRLYGSNLRTENPAHIYLTGLNKGGSLYQECIKKMDGFENYLIDIKEETHAELFPLDNIVCLSPDSCNLLKDIDPDKIYVIGGLVDENIKQQITETRAADVGVTTARLPIEENMVKVGQASHSQILAVNQVFDILLRYISSKDWKEALAEGVPRRKGYVINKEQNT